MKQVENKKKLSTKELEAFIQKQEQLEIKSSRDSILVWSILLLGFAGLFIVLQSNNTFRNSKNEQISGKKPKTIKSKIAKAEVPSSLKITKEKSNMMNVNIKGIREASEVISFEVEDYQDNADYKLDFGDGIDRVLTSKKTKHAYKMPGTYEVKLLVTYNNTTKVQFQKTITIAESIEVAEGALDESDV